jgi:release factor glutamine methyltransferase
VKSGPGTDLADVRERLRAAGCVAAAEEAAELLARVSDEETLEAWVARREQGEPLPWITGAIQFCGQIISVRPGVYVPRLQSEELARRAAAFLARSTRCAADLCTGAGPIAAHLASRVPAATVVGVEMDPISVVCARSNGVRAVLGDLAEPLRSGVFDVVTAVAPYVPTAQLSTLPRDVQRYEPRLALDGGEDGLDLVRRIVSSAARILRPGGWLLLELGGAQDELLAPALVSAGFVTCATWCDEDEDLRGLAARLVT